jgi:hypothetical protein
MFGSESIKAFKLPEQAPIDTDDLAELRRCIRTLAGRRPAVVQPAPKNPPAVFLLSPPRSGSTLTRVMLGGHPQLFAPPELQLLNFRTLGEREAAFSSERDNFWLQGTVRALMELRSFDVGQAEALMADYVGRDLTTLEFFRQIQEFAGERVVVDKTPCYALDPHTLRRLEQDFQEARYIHLVRHPCATISSFEEARLHVFFPTFFSKQPCFTPRQLAELIWVISNQNILAFLSEVPQHRRHCIRFEELVSNPSGVTRSVAAFLGIPFDAEMLEPYREKKSRMTDPIRPLARMLGDVKFHEHGGIEAEAASRWRDSGQTLRLGEVTWELAESLGYRREQSASRAAPATEAPIERVSGEVDSLEVEQEIGRLSDHEVDSMLHRLLAEQGDDGSGEEESA